jgi:hypothetical protein
MQIMVTDKQMPLPTATAVKSSSEDDGLGLEFDFGRRPREQLLGPARYLMLVRRRHADRARLSWSFRSLAN